MPDHAVSIIVIIDNPMPKHLLVGSLLNFGISLWAALPKCFVGNI